VSVGGIIVSVIRFYELLIFVYVVMSWFAGGSRSGVVADVYRVLASICEPYIGLFRRILPVAVVGGSGLDFSPLVALLVLQVVASLVPRAL
jgi:YggT family protein